MKRTPRKAPILLASFLLPVGVITAALALTGITPFGSRSLGVQDMPNQYLAFLQALRDVLTGQASALYLPSMALGGSMTGLLAYYLMSPLNLITCLFPRQALLTAVTVVYVLRVGLCGFTMAIYCGGRRGWSWRVLVPALGYALMAYMLANSFNYLWHDSVALLPVVALGVSRVAEGRGHWLYILSLAAALAVNFYIGYMLCIFSVLFFLFELLTGQGSRPGRAAAVFALGSLTAAALAAAVLVPAFFALQGGKAGLSLDGLSLAVKFDLRSLLAKFFPGAFNFDEINPAGLPNVFTGTVTASLAVLYLANGSIPRRRRVGGGVLALIIAASFWVSALDLVWHGMNVPEWYNYRYSFLLSFLLAAGADAALDRLREGTRPWHLLLPIGAMALAAVLAFAGRGYSFVAWPAALVAGAAAAVCCGGLYLALRPDAARRTLAAAGAVVLLAHVGEMGYNAARSLEKLTISSTDSARWSAYVAQKAAAMAAGSDTGNVFVRTESPDRFDLDRNEPMLFGYDGLSHYNSTVSQKNLNFLEKLGLIRFEDLYVLYGAGTTAGADSLLGVGRLVASATDKPYTPLGVSGPYTVWENPCALPIGWTADAAIAGDLAGADCFAYIQALYAAAAPEVGQDVYTAADVTDVTLEGLAETNGAYALTGASGTVAYTLTAQADGPLYAFFAIPDWPGVMVSANGGVPIFYANAQQNGSLCLGAYAAGDTVTVTVQAFTDFRIDHAAFVTENADALAAYKQAIAPGGCPLTKLSGHHFTGTFTTGEGDSLLVLTLPWDPAWRITLDGGQVQAQQIQDCLTAIPVTPGEHTIEMRYLPAGLVPGVCVSAVTALGCLVIGLRKRK